MSSYLADFPDIQYVVGVRARPSRYCSYCACLESGLRSALIFRPQGADIYGAGSILSPALAKNVITVGASEASPSSAGLADDLNEVCRRRGGGANEPSHS